MDYIFLFVLGAVVGSFLNVCIYRIPRNISLVKPGSFCPKCSTPIPFYHKIPIISFIILRGKCHYCHQPISTRYLLVELLTAFLTIASYYKFGWSSEFFHYTIFIYFLIVISFIDLFFQLVYNRILLYLLAYGVCFNLFFSVQPWREAIGGFLAGGLFMLFFAILGELLFKKESMGMGDVKFAAVIGFYLGWKMVLLALFLGFIYAMIIVLLLSFTGKYRVPKYISLAPFLAIGSLTFLYCGPTLLKWYWSLFVPVHG